MMMAQSFPAQHPGMTPHPGMPHGHQLAPGQHPVMGGPGPGMMHLGVSGPQVTQGPMVTGMPPGAGVQAPGGPMPSAHAMSHLGPQQHMFQQGHPQMQNYNPQMQQQHQQMMARQRQQMFHQQMQQGQQGQIPVTMPNGAQANAQQMAIMRASHGMNPVQASLQLQQLQAAAAANQQQQNPQLFAAHHAQIQAQQAALQQVQAQAQAQARNNQMMQEQNPTSQPPPPQPTPTPQAAPTPQPQPSQPIQGPPQQQQQQSQQPPPQQQNQNPQQPPQQQGGQPQQARDMQQMAQEAQMKAQQQHQQQNNATALLMQQRQQQAQQQQQQQAQVQQQQQQAQQQPSMRGAMILKLIQYCDHLSNATPNEATDLKHWQNFVGEHFSPEGILRQQLCNSKDGSDKRFQVASAALPRYYWTHYQSGVKQITMHIEKAREDPPKANGKIVVRSKSSVHYVFANDHRLVTYGDVRAHYDTTTNRIEYLDLGSMRHEEYLPRTILEASLADIPEQKQSPEANKKLKRAQQKQLPPPPAGIILPPTPVQDWGVTNTVLQFLETAEAMTAMGMLFEYSHANPNLSPFDALNQLVATFSNPQINAGMPPGMNPAMQMPPGQRTPGLNGPNHFASPGMAHLGLPQQGSPHVGGVVHTPSPHQSHMAGPVAMAHQQSQQGSNLSGSQGTSANTSPNVTNKRRRASAVKLEGDEGGAEVNGVGANKVKASPRVGGKRQKGTA